MGFPDSSAGKESTCNVGNLGFIPGLERSPGEGKGYPLQYSGLKNSMECISMGLQTAGHDQMTFISHREIVEDREAWHAAVHRLQRAGRD